MAIKCSVTRPGWRAFTSALLAMFGAAAPIAGCASGTTTRSAEARGESLFASPYVSDFTGNSFACSTCHGTLVRGAFDPGAKLAGAPSRAHFWGGAEVDFLRSVNQCRRAFMGASRELTASDGDAQDLAAFLLGKSADGDAQPFTMVLRIDALPPGDAKRGEAVATKACARCHGDASGAGRLTPHIPSIITDFQNAHILYTPSDRRLIFTEKVRHGGFLGYGGSMPPYGREALSDQNLSDLLTYVGL